MDDFIFENAHPMFCTVGVLRELLAPYSVDTPLLVDGIPGVFMADEERREINLTNLDCDWDDDDLWDIESPATVSQEYMDF